MDRAEHFLQLHHGDRPLVMANPWDEDSARLFASLGFQALATTSGGFAATLGRSDGHVTRDESLAYAARIVAATDLPVSADLEDCFAREPAGVAQTITLAVATGLSGCSVEDFTRDDADPIYDIGLAAERVAAAAEAAHSGPGHFVLTARAENHIHGRPDLADTIARLQAYQAAGADALFAPGLTSPHEIRAVVEAVDLPVNIVARPGLPSVEELGALGVRRVSVGSWFEWVALGAVTGAARELLGEGTFDWLRLARTGRDAASAAFGEDGD